MPANRLGPNPMVSEHFFVGTPSYENTPTIEQLRKEIQEHAYKLWERYGWDERKCWLVAEEVLFYGLERTDKSVGYRVRVKQKVHKAIEPKLFLCMITECYPVALKPHAPNGPDPQREMLHNFEAAVHYPSATGRKPCPDS